MIKKHLLPLFLLILSLSACIKEKEIPGGNIPTDQFKLAYYIINDTSYLQKVIYYDHTIYPSRDADTITEVFMREDVLGTSKEPRIIMSNPPFPGDLTCSMGMDVFCYFKKADEEVYSDSAHFQTKGFFPTSDLVNDKPFDSLAFTYMNIDTERFNKVPWEAPLLHTPEVVIEEDEN